jgi:2-oxoglutarate ferredoxin oxidoreductase subunit gamma
MIIAGFGGQGILFTGKIVAHTGMIDNREVSWLPSYGPEMRGGTANCSVCISDLPIGSPLVTEPDVLIVMNNPSYEKFIDTVISGGKVFIDSSIVKPKKKRDDVFLFEIKATQLSNEEHLEGIANMILLGKVLKETAFTTMESVKKSINESVSAKKEHLIKHNIRAIELGMTL